MPDANQPIECDDGKRYTWQEWCIAAECDPTTCDLRDEHTMYVQWSGGANPADHTYEMHCAPPTERNP